MNLIYQTYTPDNPLTQDQITDLAFFLESHLDIYGDPIEDIKKAIKYALSIDKSPGGFILKSTDSTGKIVGATVVNKTGMEGYIPPYILVYIAVHNAGRGQGIGHKLMSLALEKANGGMALHVEPDNPAKRLYEKLGFTQKYLEMRYQKPN